MSGYVTNAQCAKAFRLKKVLLVFWYNHLLLLLIDTVYLKLVDNTFYKNNFTRTAGSFLLKI